MRSQRDQERHKHLHRLSKLRDGIHLQALAGVNPHDELHSIALREFHGLVTTAYDRTADILQNVTPHQLGQGITELGLRRPSATWTYMTSDNPLGSPMDRAARETGKWWRSRNYRVE